MTTAQPEPPVIGPPPPLDAAAGAAWRTLSESFFDGGGLAVDADTLHAIRETPLMTREVLLDGRPYEDREVVIPGPAGELTMSVFVPDGHREGAPGIYWIHGGGMVLGTRFGATEALDAGAAVGAVVASVEYRLAPEHPAPAPVDDCYAGLLWFAEHAGEVGVDAGRIVLGGGSAGGGLAAATALRVRDQGGPSLAGLMLCCPMLDDRMITVAASQLGDDVLWTRASNAFGWRALLGDRAGSDEVSIYEAPGRATDLSGLPPTLIDVGSVDLFRDEDAAFASTIWACGGDAELHVWPGGYHGFELIAPDAPISLDAFEARRRWLARTVRGPATGCG
jgi:acetyl esterase/lipase